MSESGRGDPPIPFRAPRDVLEKLVALKAKWGVNRSQAIIRCIQHAWHYEIGYRNAGYIKPVESQKQLGTLPETE